MDENECSECNSIFKEYCDLRKHVKKFHREKLEEKAPLKKLCEKPTKQYKFSCNICHRNFNYQHHLRFHLKSHGEFHKVPSKLVKKCPLCCFKESSKTELYDHFKTSHNLEINLEKFQFSSKEDFEMWKSSTEKNSKSKFVKECGDIKRKSHKTISYICHRSGFYVPEGEGKRRLKNQGSSKIDAFCPAGIKAIIDSEGHYQITYIKTHVGHIADLEHLNLTGAKRKKIASKIAQNVPVCDILDEIRDISEDLLLTKEDTSVKAAYNSQPQPLKPPDNILSFEEWANELNDNQHVLFYKPVNVFSSDYPNLKNEDLILVIMNEEQARILRNLSHCVCLDRLKAYNFELHSLLVIDDLQQGLPVAFLISSRSDEDVMSLFFSCIREKIGFSFKPKVFMSDFPKHFHRAWSTIMGEEATSWLLCPWFVDDDWRSNLHLIKTKHKQVETYKNLRKLLQEPNEAVFLHSLEEFLNKTLADSDTALFSNYFKEKFENNVKCWAYCYRLHFGFNMQLERIHKTIEYFYCTEKIRRFEDSINNILRFVNEKMLERSIGSNKAKLCSKLEELRKRHARSMEMDVNLVSEVDDGWQVFSLLSKTAEVYKISKILEKCGCQLACYDCNICIHKYYCSCFDSYIRWNMCKHIHLLGRKMCNQAVDISEEVSVNQTLPIIDQNIEIYIDPSIAEIVESSQTIITTIEEPKHHKTLEEKKEELKICFSSLIDSIQRNSQVDFLQKSLATLEASLENINENSLPVAEGKVSKFS